MEARVPEVFVANRRRCRPAVAFHIAAPAMTCVTSPVVALVPHHGWEAA